MIKGYALISPEDSGFPNRQCRLCNNHTRQGMEGFLGIRAGIA